jgi:hypothetical protein
MAGCAERHLSCCGSCRCHAVRIILRQHQFRSTPRPRLNPVPRDGRRAGRGHEQDGQARTVGQVREAVDDLGDVSGEDEILSPCQHQRRRHGSLRGRRWLDGKCGVSSSPLRKSCGKASVRYRHIQGLLLGDIYLACEFVGPQKDS